MLAPHLLHYKTVLPHCPDSCHTCNTRPRDRRNSAPQDGRLLPHASPCVPSRNGYSTPAQLEIW